MRNAKIAVIVSLGLLIVASSLSTWLIVRITKTGESGSSSPIRSRASSPSTAESESKIVKTNAKYTTTTARPTGWFTTGQNADIVLSAIDFNNSGGPLLFNHQGGIATDGHHFLVADRNNNRILIWNHLPTGNTSPDIVLGQVNFTANNPGTGLNNLDWPVSVATDGTRVFVADTYNNRILVWSSFPTRNDQPADFAINDAGNKAPNLKRHVAWPWAVWTNGQKLVVTATGSSLVLIWNNIPTHSDQAADLALSAGGKFGTPRSIASDGTNLMIGDHNAKPNNNNPGNFFWKTFPMKDDQPYDFFMAGATPTNQQMGEIFWGGAFLPNGAFATIGEGLYIWKHFPQSSDDLPTTIVGTTGPNNGGLGATANSPYQFDAGDGSDVALAGNSLYISTCNGNKVVGYKTIPATTSARPDFVIGARDLKTNTLETNFIMSNPVPATDGKSLFVSSDFDRKLYVYLHLPNQSNAHPDYVYPYGGWDNALYGNTFAEADTQKVYIWKTLPTDGKAPDITLSGRIGSIVLKEVKGVAIDDKYFYISDATANKVYVFEGIPTANSTPRYTLDVDQPFRLSSDGQFLVVTTTLSNATGHVRIYRVDQLSNNAKPWVLQENQVSTNLPQSAVVSHGSLMIADTGFNRVLIWKQISDALNGAKPDVILGQGSLTQTQPLIGHNTTFWPSNLAFDGSYLWVGEFKFSERLLRFSVH